MADRQIAVKVQDLTKSFKIPLESSNGLKQKIINTLKGHKGYREFTPLNNISFEVENGDFFGIVGRNGSGKSTLLKTIAGIYAPNEGLVQVNGKLVPFIELGVGFNEELTGRENVFLNGALLGFSHAEMEVMYEEIISFAEIGDFMEEKLKNYSSGMQVRLAFSIAIRAQADILLLDEVLAVGDEAFQRKCYNYFAQLKKEKKTVILVTHDMDAVQRFCNKAIMIEKGKIIERGSVKSVSERYIESNAGTGGQKNHNGKTTNNFADIEVSLKDGVGKQKTIFSDRDDDSLLDINLVLLLKQNINKEAFCSLLIKNASGEVLARFSSEDVDNGNAILDQPRKGSKFIMTSKIQNIFGEGDYSIALSFKSIDRSEVYIESLDISNFSIVGLGSNKTSLRPDSKTIFEKR